MKTQIMTITMIGALGATAAQAASNASAVTDLNLRAGPGPNHQIVSVIPDDGQVTIEGCLAESAWCKIDYNGTEGWAYGAYLTASLDGQPTVVIENRDAIEVETVTYEDTDADATAAGGTVGAIVGGAIGGPAGATVGAAAGGALGAAADPDQTTVTYVRQNQAEPVYLDGEVVVGAQLPDVVELRSVPDSEFTYANVNNVPVLVEPEDRRVVYIVR